MLMLFLADQNTDYFGDELKKLNHEVEYVKNLRKQEERFRNDYDVIEHARIHKMILITKDRENGQYCQDHNLPCIWLSDEILFEKLVLPYLDELKDIIDDSKKSA